MFICIFIKSFAWANNYSGDKVYVQKNDLAYFMRGAEGISVPASIIDKVFGQIFIVTDENRYEFVEFSSLEEIEFFKKCDWMVDYNLFDGMTEEEFKAEMLSLNEELLKLNEPTYNPTIHKIAVCDYIMATYGKIFYTLLSKKFPEQRFLLNTLAIKELSLQKENDIMFTIINSQNLKLSTLKSEFGDDWEVKFLRSYDIHVWLNSSSPFANETC